MNLTLPFPPSSNRYWRNFRGRMVISAEAKAYRQRVALLCIQNGVKPMVGNLSFEARLYRPAKRGDLDNRLKILLDCLQGSAFENDSQITEIRMSRHDDKVNPRVEVMVNMCTPNRAQRLDRIEATGKDGAR